MNIFNIFCCLIIDWQPYTKNMYVLHYSNEIWNLSLKEQLATSQNKTLFVFNNDQRNVKVSFIYKHHSFIKLTPMAFSLMIIESLSFAIFNWQQKSKTNFNVEGRKDHFTLHLQAHLWKMIAFSCILQQQKSVSRSQGILFSAASFLQPFSYFLWGNKF